MQSINLPARIFRITCLFLLFSVQLLWAQDGAKTTITTKGGEKITGKVIEAVPDQYIKMELADGSVKKIASSDIASMDTDQSSNKSKDKVKIAPSAIGGVGVAYDLSSKQGYILVEPKIIGGFKAGMFRMGGGVSFIYALSTVKSSATFDPYSVYVDNNAPYAKSMQMLPIFANFHFDFGKKKVKPSLDISGGYPVNVGKSSTSTGLDHTDNPDVDDYGTPYNEVTEYNYTFVNKTVGLGYLTGALGVTCEVSKKLNINVAAQYQLLAFTSKSTLYSDYYYSFWNQAGQYYNTYTGTNDPYTVSTKRILNSVGLSVTVIY